MAKIKVLVAGALGRMGANALDTFLNNSDKFELVAGVVRDLKSADKNMLESFQAKGVRFVDNIDAELSSDKVDVLVELTTPDSVFENSKKALKNGVRPVIGATGLSEDDINELSNLASKNGLGTLIAPNFAIGAILMMKFAGEAARYMDRYEIIEWHHDKKVDSPSGTAIKTAKLMSQMAKGPNQVTFKEQPARGETHYDIPIHSLRIQGMVAHQEVIFGGQGQTLTIRHDSIDRSSFMPGIMLSCEKVIGLDKLVYGLENII